MPTELTGEALLDYYREELAEARRIERELIRVLVDKGHLPLDDYLASEHVHDWQPIPKGPAERWHNWVCAQAREEADETNKEEPK